VKNDLIEINPEKVSGTLVFAGARVPIKNLFDYLEGGETFEDFSKVFRLFRASKLSLFWKWLKNLILNNRKSITKAKNLSRLQLLFLKRDFVQSFRRDVRAVFPDNSPAVKREVFEIIKVLKRFKKRVFVYPIGKIYFDLQTVAECQFERVIKRIASR